MHIFVRLRMHERVCVFTLRSSQKNWNTMYNNSRSFLTVSCQYTPALIRRSHRAWAGLCVHEILSDSCWDFQKRCLCLLKRNKTAPCMLLSVGVLQPFAELFIPMCTSNFTLLTKITKHYLNQNQYYSQNQWIKRNDTEHLASGPWLPFFQASAPFYNVTALPALLQKTKMKKAYLTLAVSNVCGQQRTTRPPHATARSSFLVRSVSQAYHRQKAVLEDFIERSCGRSLTVVFGFTWQSTSFFCSTHMST